MAKETTKTKTSKVADGAAGCSGPVVIEPNRLYTRKEVAALFDCSLDTINRYRRNRGMPFGNPTPGRVLGKQLIDWLKTARKHKSAAAN